MNKKIKVAFVGVSFFQKRQANLLNELTKYFHIFALVPKWSEKLKWKGTPKGMLINEKEIKFKVIWHDSLFIHNRMLTFYPTLILSLNKIKPNVIVINGYHSILGIIVLIYSLIKNIPLIVISYFNPNIPYNIIFRFFLRFLYILPKYIVVLTNKMKKKAIDELKINPNKVTILTESGYSLNCNIKKLKDKIKIVYAGRHVYEKGLYFLILAYKKIQSPNLELIICGEGPLTSSLKKFIKNNKISNVKFLGYVEDMKEVLYNSDIFIYPSIKTKNWEEQFGYSVLQAMSFGLPVIVSNCGSLPELVKENGIIIRQKNVKDIVSAIKMLIQNPKLYSEFSKKSLERAKDFSLKAISEKWKRLIIITQKQ